MKCQKCLDESRKWGFDCTCLDCKRVMLDNLTRQLPLKGRILCKILDVYMECGKIIEILLRRR